MKISIIFISIAVLFLALNFNLPLVKEKKQHYITTFTGIPAENVINDENSNVSPTGATLKNIPVLSNTGSGKKESYILPTKEQILVIGKNAGENNEVGTANEVTFNIKEELPRQRQAYLEYDLFGFEDFTCVSHSINDLVSMGGKIIRLRNEWTHQAEKIDVSDLKQGNNIIRFHIPEQAHYRYKVKNIRIRFAEKTNNGRQIIVNLPTDASHYGEYFYLNGYIQTQDTVSYMLYANEKPVYVFDNHFDEIVSFTNKDNPVVELKAVFNDGYVCSAKVHFSENKQYHFLSNESWVVPVYRGIIEPLSVNKFNFNGISLFTEENAVKEKKNLTIMGLRNEDMPLLDAGMVNVTADYKGFRCLPHGTLFDKSVDFRLSYDSTLIPKGYGPDDIRTFFYNEKTKKWEMLEYVSIDKENKQVISKTNHFTDFINGILKTPELPQTMAYTPTSMKDMKYADPVAHVNMMAPPTANNMGTANMSYPIDIPAGRQGLQPNLSVNYNSEKNTGIPGNGWDIPFPSISIDTRWGVPRYSTTKETEEYLLNGEQLVELSIVSGDTERLPLIHMDTYRNRDTSGQVSFAYRVEGAFHRIIRHGTNPTNYWWEVVDKNGTTYYYGKYHDDSSFNPACVLRNIDNGCIAEWTLCEVRDLYNNNIKYEYGVPFGSQLLTINDIHFVYPHMITYTGHSSTQGAYSVEFVPGGTPDGKLSGRYGFISGEIMSIGQILVKYNNDFVKGYYFKYKTGAYGKNLLCSIVEYTDTNSLDTIINKNCDELATDYIHGAKAHVFQYYEEDSLIFNNTPVSILSDNEEQEQIFNFYTDPTLQSIGRSKSYTVGGGASICFGFNTNVLLKTKSIGANFSFSKGPLIEKVQLLDINGDGLLDKVVKENGDYLVHQGQLNSNNELIFSSNAYLVQGLPRLSRSYSTTWGAGLEAQWRKNFLGISRSWTRQITDRYFTDINADGYPDFVDNNELYFNFGGSFETVTGSSTIPFPGDSCYSIEYSGSVDSSLINVISDGGVTSFSFRRDPVKVWIAPFDSRVDIFNHIKRINPSSESNRIYCSIQRNNNMLYIDTIEAFDTLDHIDSTGAFSVQKGDYIFFHMHPSASIGTDEVNWDPVIYLLDTLYQVPNTPFDADEKPIYKFQYSKDAVISDKQYFTAPYTGHVLVNGSISSPAQSDTLTFMVKYNQTYLIDTIYPDNQSFSRQFNYDMAVNEDDSMMFRLFSKSNVNWSEIEFSTRILYYQADSFPDLDTADSVAFYPSLQMSIFPQIGLVSKPIYITAGTYTVYPDLLFLNNNLNGDVVYTIKTKRNMLNNKSISVLNSTVQGTPLQNSSSFTLSQADSVYFDFFTTNPDMGKFVDTALVKLINNPNIMSKAGFYSTFPDSMQKFGNLYRHWGQFSYFDSLSPLYIDRAMLTYTNCLPDSNAIDSIPVSTIDTSTTFDDVSGMFSSAGADNLYITNFAPMMANNKDMKWEDYIKSARISSLSMISQDGYLTSENSSVASNNTFEEEVPGADLEDPVASNNGTSISHTIKKVSQQGTYSFTYSYDGAVSATYSHTDSRSKLDFMDMNGDRYPDIVGNDIIQYSTSQGGLAEDTVHINDITSSKGSGNSFGVSEGIKSTNFKNTTANGGNKSQLKNIDGSASLGSTTGESKTNFILMDINGDGLPDKVDKDNGTVAINLGYRFEPDMSWSVPFIQNSSSSSVSISPSIGASEAFTQIKHYSWALGFGASRNNSLDISSFMDVNNDGLPDICFLMGNNLYANINRGTSFDTAQKLIFSNFNNSLSTTTSCNIGTNLACTFGVPIPPKFKLTFSPYVDVSYNLSSTQSRIMDMNGDNTPDYVYVDNNNSIQVKYGIPRKVNMLKKVITPLKSSYTLDYAVVYPTANNPSSKWVMSSLKTFDGFAGDGIDTMYYTFTYENPYYHRMERDFFGFEKVTTRQVNDFGLCMRSYEDKYHNNNYLFKGLKKYEVVKDNYDNKFVETYYTYDAKEIATGNIVNLAQLRCPCTVYPAISQEDKYFYEGQGLYTIHTQKTYRHGPYGNVKEYIDYGDTAYVDDDIKATMYYTYNLTHNLTGMVNRIDVYNNSSNFLMRRRTGSYNAMGSLTQINSYIDYSTAAVTDITYDTLGNITHIEYPANVNNERLEYTYVYDSIAYTYPARVTDYWGNHSSVLYDLKWGLPLEQTDMAGNKTQYSYYDDGKLKSVTGPYEINTGHHAIDCEYWDEVSDTINFWARTWHFDPMDTTNQMLTVNFADGLKRNIQSKRKANVNGTDEFIVSGRIYFDNLGRVVENHLPVTESFGEDSVFHSGYNSYYSTLYYDILDRPTQQLLPDNTVYSYSYSFGQDFFGNTCFTKTTTDPKSLTTTECTNASGVKTTVFAQLSATTAFVYDPLGQLTQSRDPEDNYTYYVYDRFGRLTQRTHPDAGITRFTYDLAGNVLSKETQNLINNNELIQYIYDDNRLVNIVYPENPAMNVYYEYGQPNSGNQTGRLTKQQDASGAQTFTYGKLGELIENAHTFVVPNGYPYTFFTSWDYDTWGRTKSITYPDGEIVYYGYDHGGNLVTMNSVKGSDNYYFINDIRYNEFGKRTRIDYNNGIRTTFDYNAANQRMTTLDCRAGDAIQHFEYSYDDVGNITGIANTSNYFDIFGGSFSYSYNYDELYRLSYSEGSFTPYNQNTIGFKTNMEYTASGNIYRRSLSASTLINGYINNIGYDRYYQYNSRPHTISTMNNEINFTWDANGNMTHKEWDGGLRSLCWDEENRLTSVFDQADEMQLSMYLYDGDGERAWKFAGNANLMQINGQTVLQQTILNKTLYVNPYMVVTDIDYSKHYFMENERVATKLGSGFGAAAVMPGDTSLTFIVGTPDSLGSDLYKWLYDLADCAGDTGQLLLEKDLKPVDNSENNTEKDIYFYHPDHLGSTGFVTDANAKPIQHLQYLPFGELFVSQMANSFDSRYKFTGKERDMETGLDYFGARYMDNEGPIWLSVDAMSDKYPSLSPYNYCAWNPVVLIDPDGNDMGWVEDPDNPNAGVHHDPNINTPAEAEAKGLIYHGQTISGNMSNGWGIYGDEQGNMTMYMPEIPVDGGKMSEHARVMSNPIVKAIHKGQVAWLPDYVGFSISGNAFVGGGFGGDLTIGYIKGEGLFGNASLREGAGMDISVGIGFNYGNYSGKTKPSAYSLSNLSTYQNFGTFVNFSTFQDISSKNGKAKIGKFWNGGSLNISFTPTIWGWSAGTSITTKPIN